jgi:hypothetical protein
MHILISLLTVYAVWRKVVWMNWKDYHTTMLYIYVGNLLYQFFTVNHYLWRINPDYFTNYVYTEMLYTFVIFPGTVLLFLASYPRKLHLKALHYLKWIAIYVGIEWIIGVEMGYISYQYGWNLAWSAIFDCTMFPMLRLHHKSPIMAYVLSAFSRCSGSTYSMFLSIYPQNKGNVEITSLFRNHFCMMFLLKRKKFTHFNL